MSEQKQPQDLSDSDAIADIMKRTGVSEAEAREILNHNRGCPGDVVDQDGNDMPGPSIIDV